MSKQSFTPGPWEYEDQCASVWADGQQVAQTEASPGVGMRIHWDMEQRRANGHLIAASPDLLAALENLLDRYVSVVVVNLNWNPSTEQEVIDAERAIAKAKGGAQ